MKMSERLTKLLDSEQSLMELTGSVRTKQILLKKMAVALSVGALVLASNSEPVNAQSPVNIQNYASEEVRMRPIDPLPNLRQPDIVLSRPIDPPPVVRMRPIEDAPKLRAIEPIRSKSENQKHTNLEAVAALRNFDGSFQGMQQSINALSQILQIEENRKNIFIARVKLANSISDHLQVTLDADKFIPKDAKLVLIYEKKLEDFYRSLLSVRTKEDYANFISDANSIGSMKTEIHKRLALSTNIPSVEEVQDNTSELKL